MCSGCVGQKKTEKSEKMTSSQSLERKRHVKRFIEREKEFGEDMIDSLGYLRFNPVLDRFFTNAIERNEVK
jgi:hypothetical protein